MAAYFSYYSVYGARGCFVWREKRHALAKQREKVKILEHKKNSLERKVALFEQEIDSDLLEQVSWQVLRMIPENYCLITYSQ